MFYQQIFQKMKENFQQLNQQNATFLAIQNIIMMTNYSFCLLR